jgi:hypothetical protein
VTAARNLIGTSEASFDDVLNDPGPRILWRFPIERKEPRFGRNDYFVA